MPKNQKDKKYSSMKEYKKKYLPGNTMETIEKIEKPYEYGGIIAAESIEKNKSILERK